MGAISGVVGPSRPGVQVLVGAAVLAAIGPLVMGFSLPPSSTMVNQGLAVMLWGLWVAVVAAGTPGIAGHTAMAATAPALAALCLVVLGILFSGIGGALPMSLMLLALGLVLAAALMLVTAAGIARADGGGPAVVGVLMGLMIAALASALIAWVQVFLPAAADGDWIASSGLPGRAVGNLRQPNHLASLLLWGAIATACLWAMGRLSEGLAWTVHVLIVAGVVLSGSRTGALGLLMLMAWGALDRRLPSRVRLALAVSPVLYLMLWAADAALARTLEQAAAVELGSGTFRGDISSSRFAIWANTLTMIAREPLRGVGFGQFNIAWSLTPFPHRPTALFDHSHNLVLQLFVELGVPLGLAICSLLTWSLWLAARRAFAADGVHGLAGRATFMMAATMALHSQLEYPLWYAYFLLPTAVALGYAMGLATPNAAAGKKDVPPPVAGHALSALGVVCALAGLYGLADYRRVADIYAPSGGAAPLEARIALGQRSWLFAHHADYAAATTGLPNDPRSQWLAWQRAPHQLLDARLMMAWIDELQRRGEQDLARHLAQRLREFRKPEAQNYFADCAAPGVTASICLPPTSEHSWRAFTARSAAPAP